MRLCWECGRAGDNSLPGNISSGTSSLHFPPIPNPSLFLLLPLECRNSSVYIHPSQVLQPRTISLPASPSPTPWIRPGGKNPPGNLPYPNLFLRRIFSQRISRSIFIWKCLWTWIGASKLSFRVVLLLIFFKTMIINYYFNLNLYFLHSSC